MASSYTFSLFPYSGLLGHEGWRVRVQIIRCSGNLVWMMIIWLQRCRRLPGTQQGADPLDVLRYLRSDHQVTLEPLLSANVVTIGQRVIRKSALLSVMASWWLWEPTVRVGSLNMGEKP